MPRLTDVGAIRAILETQRPWAAYALADLEPEAFAHSTWCTPEDGASALALVYQAFSIPVLLTVGAAAALRRVLDEVDAALAGSPEVYGVVRPDVLPLLAQRLHLPQPRLMYRMLLDSQRFEPVPTPDVVPLGPADLETLQKLYADGLPVGEAPEFFLPSMLREGIYVGVWDGSQLLAVAGTHVLAAAEGVAAIGNVYTRRDRRGQGLGARVTSAVTTLLLERRIRTIVLNVRQSNAVAVRLYQRLGFQPYCDYYEVPAFRNPSARPAST
jgi:ribosomal protein S18 acetylase RimI-like enzyme